VAKQLHKRFSDGEVKMLLEKYLSEKVELSYLLEILGIKRRRFFGLLKEYKRNPARFSMWKKVIDDCKVKPIYALSPQARGKIERPYRWLQDRIVRTCAREKIRTVQEAEKVLEAEVERYNYRQVHSTTKEIPIIRFQRAQREKNSLFRDFTVPSPYRDIKDIFCLKATRVVDPYHKVSFNNLNFKVHTAPLRKEVQLRITPDLKTGMAEVRIWYKDILTDVRQVKNSDLNLVKF